MSAAPADPPGDPASTAAARQPARADGARRPAAGGDPHSGTARDGLDERDDTGGEPPQHEAFPGYERV
jgi:hypothetical protein